MTISRFRPEIWSAQLLVALEKAHIFAAPGVVNRDYEGEIQAGGDTVRITSISDPSVGTYTSNSTSITYEELTDAQRTLVIDTAKYFAFEIDDVDRAQARGNVVPEALRRAAYKLRDVVDQTIAGFYTSVPTANCVNSGSAVAVTTSAATDAYDKVLVPLGVELDEANIPSEGRWVGVPPWFYGRLQRDDRFVDWQKSQNADALRSGVVGNAAGFTILKSNNIPLVTGDDYAIMAGVPGAISFAEQINQVEAFRSQDSFADRMRGLHLWGAKVIRPEMLAFCLTSQT